MKAPVRKLLLYWAERRRLSYRRLKRAYRGMNDAERDLFLRLVCKVLGVDPREVG
jgi:hypothetical protein